MNQVNFPVFVGNVDSRPPSGNVRAKGKLVQKPLAFAVKRVKLSVPARVPTFLRQCEIIRTVGLYAFARESGLDSITVARYVAGCAVHRSTERTIVQTAVRLDSVTKL
jgi:hypothetical protein